MDLTTLLTQIKKEDLVLPDFQRNFVWDGEMMRKLYSSVLCQMPIGSILTLESDKKEFACKKIGAKSKTHKVELQDGNLKSYLIDGQQRLTSLFAGFTTYYFDTYSDKKDLASKDLAKFYFLKVPRSTACNYDYKDLFSVQNKLSFNYLEMEAKGEYFTSSDMVELVESKPASEVLELKKNGAQNFSIEDNLVLDKIEHFCTDVIDRDSYYIPLQLINNENKAVIYTFENILTKISLDFKVSDNQRENDIARRSWVENIKKYLQKCLSNLQLNELTVEKSDKARAIDIYSNLNIQGVSLNVFDLLMAKMGTVTDRNFYEIIIDNIQKPYTYPDNLFKNGNWYKQNTKYKNVASFFNIIEDDDIETIYINMMLNVLGLYIAKLNNKKFDPILIKEKALLDLDPNQIKDNIGYVCTGMERAMMFYQNRCGIRKLSDINYKAQFTVIAYFFTYDEFFNRKEIHDLFEYWYWITLFGYLYPSNQNVVILNELPRFAKLFREKDLQKILDLENEKTKKFLKFPNYSDKATLTMAKDDTGKRNIPNSVMTKYICQFYLSLEYYDFQKEDVKLSAYLPNEQKLDIHHIIPLGSVKKIGETTKMLRDDEENPLNSPLNMIYITKSANLDISDMDYSKYSKDENIQKRLGPIGCTPSKIGSCKDNEKEIQDFLDNRFVLFQGAIEKRLSDLYGEFRNKF